MDWKCNSCNQEEGVENGVCPNCGPCQTTPLSEAAQIEAGVPEAAAERAAQAAAEEAAQAQAAEQAANEEIAAESTTE